MYPKRSGTNELGPATWTEILLSATISISPHLSIKITLPISMNCILMAGFFGFNLSLDFIDWFYRYVLTICPFYG